jgi:hypothetical protein
MSVSIQLIQIEGETIIEVSGFREISGVYLENTDVDISVEGLRDIDDKIIRLSVEPNTRKDFAAFAFDIQIIAQRITFAQLLNGSKIFIVPKSIDVALNDTQAIKELLQKNGGIWIDGLPRSCISEIIKNCSF